MSKVVLYRKYRPQKFGEVLGQDHIVGILKNAVKLGRVSHAYLFSGPRGTGKTSVARILAKEIGCVDVDLMEIDAASSRGIDEIRTLREGIHFVPLRGNVKVYIIDEVHMLTKEAFNALLKTLEEPPSHVVFILATTEIEKVPETIISRCQNFSFKKIPEAILRSSINEVAKSEGFQIDDESAGLIALFAEGSFRDALGLLDKILGFGNKKITGNEARKILSAPPEKLVEDFILSFVKKDLQSGMNALQEAIKENIDTGVFLKIILRDVRSMLLLKISPNMRKLIEETLGEKEFNFIDKNKEVLSQKELGSILKILLDAHDVRSRSYLPQLPLELALLKIFDLSQK